MNFTSNPPPHNMTFYHDWRRLAIRQALSLQFLLGLSVISLFGAGICHVVYEE